MKRRTMQWLVLVSLLVMGGGEEGSQQQLLDFPTDPCLLPREIGRCRKYIERYFYSPTDQSCQKFGYGGCEGNANNFPTLQVVFTGIFLTYYYPSVQNN